MVAMEGRLRAHEMDGKELQDAADFLRGKIRPVAVDVDVATDRRAREAHFDWYRQTRRNALALWLETADVHGHPTGSGDASAGSAAAAALGVVSTSVGGWPNDGATRVPCLLWCSGRWHCACAGWSAYPEKETLKVVFAGYDEEDAVFMHPQDSRIRQAVLDPRCGRDNPNHQVLKGIFPKEGDFVRVHVVDAGEAQVFLQPGVFLAGVVASPLAAHDSSLVRAVGLAGTEGGHFVVPNTRMEHVSAEEFAHVVEGLKIARNQVLRQLDIATSQTIAIRVVSEVGEVADDRTEISIWALGDQMLIRVWQRKGEFMLETSVPASDGLDAVGLEDTGLTVLSEGERKQLLDGVRRRLRLSRGRLTMVTEIDYSLGRRDAQHHAAGGIPAEIYQETHTVEGVLVKTAVEPAEVGDGLRVRSQTMPPGPERMYDIFAHPEDWAALGYPSLPWLNAERASPLGQQLTRCVGAREGSLVLRIGRRVLRCQDWFPMPPEPEDNYSKRARYRPQAATSKPREGPDNQNVNGDASSCVSGAEPGLCSCRVVLKKGAALPLSIPEPSAATIEGRDGNNNNNNNNNVTPAPSGCRWLVVVKTIGEKLTLSLIQPSRRSSSSSSRPSPSPATTASLRVLDASGASGARKLHQESKRREVRRSLSLVATWGDWAHLGYGPLPWMSHEQKAFISRLSLYWVTVPYFLSRAPETSVTIERPSRRDRTQDRTKVEVAPHHWCKEAFLRYRPIICSLTRAVGASKEMVGRAALRGDGCRPVGGGSSGAATATPHSEESSEGKEISATSLVFVRDEGSVFRVEVAGLGSEGGPSRRQGGLTRLEKTFGKEAWLQTGLGELLWMDCSSRQYLAHRLAQQVAFTTAAQGDSREERQNRGETNKNPAALDIVSDLPLPYWRGVVKIARLGSHAEGVFVKITDAGRRLRIEAEDFEGGPRLASSMVSLEAWTAATGIVTLRPPTDSQSFKKILEDQLAALLGAGFRSRTSRLEKKRLSKGTTQQGDGGGRRWRGTFLHLSEMEKGEISKFEGDGSGGDTSDAGTRLQVQQAQSPRDLTPLEQKRALRLEMLTRMIEEFHAKHGNPHRGGAKKSRTKAVGLRVPSTPVSATAADPGGQNHDLVRQGATAPTSTTGGTGKIGRINVTSATTTRIENNDSMSAYDNDRGRMSSNRNDNSGVLLPAIASFTPHGGKRQSESNTQGPSTLSPQESTPFFSSPDPPLAPARELSGGSLGVGVHGSGVTATPSNQVTPLHICVCCGGEGGRGHGRRCEHIFRRCGFCRVDEVQRVLGIRDPHGRARGEENGPGLDRTDARDPTLLPSKDDGRASGEFDAREEAQEEGDEFEWVTDSEEEDPEFQCDSCGRVIEETADRFHCETCGDHDSCQACFNSSRKVANGQHGVQEGGVGGEHLACHDVTRIMGKPALPGR